MAYLSSPLDTALNSTSKLRILRLLIEQDRTVSAREASRLTGMSLPAIRGALESLVKSGLVDREISGRQFLCRANREHLLLTQILVPLFASEAKWPMMLFAEIRQVIASMEKQAARGPSRAHFDLPAVWIFGSVAKGMDHPGSDFDLMFLARNDHSAVVVSEVLSFELPDLSRRLGMDVRPVVVTMAQAKHQLQRHDPFMSAALRSARVVHGEIPAELNLGKKNKRSKGQ